MDKIILLDSNSLVNRAFYALPPLTTVDGLYTNAIHGFISMLNRLILEEKPTHICAVFDEKADTFRKAVYSEYKANRKGMPDELAVQLDPLKTLLRSMGIKVLSKPGYEADDIIGTLAKRFNEPSIIVTGDKDSLQLLDSSTRVFYTRIGVTDIVKYDCDKLLEESLTPQKIIEFKALAGDASDNIPGAKGIGKITAMKLLDEYGCVENIYENIDEIKGSVKDKLIAAKEMVFLSKKLATIDLNADIECVLSDIKFSYPLPKEAFAAMTALELKKLASRFTYEAEIDVSDTPPWVASTAVDSKKCLIPSVVKPVLINSVAELKNAVEKIPSEAEVAVYWGEKVVLAYCGGAYEFEINAGLLGDNGITLDDVLSILNNVYGGSFSKVFFDLKQEMHNLSQYGSTIKPPYEDLSLKAYLINPNRKPTPIEDLIDSYGAETGNIASSILTLNKILDERMQSLELTNLYKEIELPLVKCLYDMERSGFCIDRELLEELGREYEAILKTTEEEIYKTAGENFNINSPKQLAVILFDKMKLRHGKKNKTGLSVSAEVLDEIDHPIASLLLRYRQYSKLKSTYIDGMRQLVNKMTGRAHTSFKQNLTVTGRLSSTEPNLQNIPYRTAEGREIRKMFIASRGCELVTADYSQIELRLLAHFSHDEHLVEVYKNFQDVHLITAARINGVPINEVTDEMRSAAKAVNFGIIYGISSFGLSKQLSIPPSRAKEYIDEYFRMYPSVKKYMDANIELAERDGYLRTICNRIRFFPELKSAKFNIRAFAKRAAMNMPLQGSAADIIKLAMIRVDNELKKGGFKAKLILQVHDELIINCPIEETERVKKLLKECMESAITLSVPLIANVGQGRNWYEAK